MRTFAKLLGFAALVALFVGPLYFLAKSLGIDC